MATAAERQAYITRVAATLRGKSTRGLFPSVIIAQAALESGWGKSLLAAQYNNHFGMKRGTFGTDYGGWSSGKTVTLKTGEVYNGQSCTIDGVFRVYDSLADSVADHNGLFYRLSRYAAVCKATTPEAQIRAIADGGYATATHYVTGVLAVITANNLTRFDTPEYGYDVATDTTTGNATGNDGEQATAGKKKLLIWASVAAAAALALAIALPLIIKRKR